jgi:hypothetical protein
MIIVKSLYGLKGSAEQWCAHFASTLWGMGLIHLGQTRTFGCGSMTMGPAKITSALTWMIFLFVLRIHGST